MSRKNKVTARVHTKEGMPIKVWVNRKTGTVLPSNWKQQAGYLAQTSTYVKKGAR